MKSHYSLLTLLFFGIVSLIIFDAAQNNADSHTSGAPATHTGSPGDGGATCKNCHAGPNPTTEAGLITSNIPAAGYSPGQTYTLTATVTRSGHTKFGFEISPQNPSGTQLGTLIVTNSTEMQLVGVGKYITHKIGGVNGVDSRTWQFDWTAPAAGTGDVTFYGAFNITNAMNNSTGDTTVLSTLTVSECALPATPGSIIGPVVICPNSASEFYSIATVPGATSYTWTFPPGWTLLSPMSDSIQVAPALNSGIITVSASNACGTSQISSIAVSIDGLGASIAATDASCNGGSNGSALAQSVSGVGPFQFLWSPGGQTSASITNLSPGSYSVTITDGAGCSSSATTSINQPTALQLSSSVTDATCGASNGAATVNVSGGIPSYSYSWNSVPVQVTQVASNLPAGIYTVTVTDANGCIATSNVIVSTVAGPTATALNISNVACHNGNDGAAIASVASGTPPFTYLWSPSGGSDSVALNLHAGMYSVVVTDVNGCSSAASVAISEPSQITLLTTTTDAACGQSNGSANVMVNGGVGGYSYHWNSIPVQTTATASNLPAGSYVVIVTDLNGCTASETVGVSNTSGPTLQTGTVTNVTCFGGSNGALSVNVSGGTGPFTYQWSPSGGTDTLATNLTAGSYSFTVTDATGCISVLTEIVSEPTELVVQAGPDMVLCVGESSTLGVSPVASGGVAGYTYLWSPAGALSNATDSMPVASPTSTTTFTVLVTDLNGCTNSDLVVLTVNPVPSTPVITATTDSLFSTSAISYQWYLNGNILPGATSQNYVPQQTGNYSVVVSNAFGCTATSADFFFNFSSIGKLMDEKFFDVYPNPASQNLFIRLAKSTEVEIHVAGITGENMVCRVTESSLGIYMLDVSGLAPGVYILEVVSQSENKISRKVFIRE